MIVGSRATGVALAAAVLAFSGSASSEAERPEPAAFERLKSLTGEWSGKAVWDQGGKKGSVDFKLSYKVTSGGRAVAETMFPGTPGEMLTVYYADGDSVTLVHYCSAGNQPHMKLEPSTDGNDLSFRCAGGTNMIESDSHMHSARIQLVDETRIKGAWSSIKGGAVQWTAEAELTRVR
jgi:hypothetical protein